VGGVLLAQASSKQSALQADVDVPGRVSNEAYASRDNSVTSERTLGISCAVGGGVALVTGAILYGAGRRGRAEEGARVSFVPGPGSGLLSYGGSF
jgi:hypothetical protein